MTNLREKLIVTFLNCSGIKTDSVHALDGIIIQRDELLSEDRYSTVKEMIPELKTVYSSSYMTSLQKPADKSHRWPLINIVRQILKSCGYQFTPKRVANGYTKAGKKLYKRFFIITKITAISN
jgi:hypothetical protein